jgi:hypothetical protein
MVSEDMMMMDETSLSYSSSSTSNEFSSSTDLVKPTVTKRILTRLRL